MFFSAQHPSRTVKTEQSDYLFFSGTSYLGMAVNPIFQNTIYEGLGKYGANYGSSRTSNLRLRVFEEIEGFLSKWTGAEACLSMSSGFLAGQLVAQWIRELAKEDYIISYAPNTHPAVFSGLESFDFVDFESWVSYVVALSHSTTQNLVLVCNSVDVLNAKIHDFSWVKNLYTPNMLRKVILIADDSHGIGVIGEKGKGIFHQIPIQQGITKLVIASMGKALGMPAGMIIGDREVIAHLQKSSFYSGASPALPAYCYAFLNVWDEYEKQMEILKENISFFSGEVKNLGLFEYDIHYPVFRTYRHQLYSFLLEHQVLISSFPYPKPDSELITRIVLSSLHTQEDLAYLIKLLKQYVEKYDEK
ncbi:MAG: aminotransferase class I/II-fold pyridoxal phosphate-dependent enzyme [Thermoflexibacter sp.]|jgi:7-keto-8-aminopelargonate synthetase-like enzyme|nr:aminotransferase class I/II-fold pyridoxal phosphate-dependent enzyme [Thermoflexibacter sp.]